MNDDTLHDSAHPGPEGDRWRVRSRRPLYYDRLSPRMMDWSWYRDPSLMTAIAQFVPKQARRILDLCGGNGELTEHLARAFPERKIFHSDLSPEMVRNSQRRLARYDNVRVFCGDWITPIRNHRFDCVIVKNSLHALARPDVSLQQLKEVLSGLGSIVICETIAPDESTLVFLAQLFGMIDRTGYKRTIFSERSLLALLDCCKLSAIGEKRYFDQEIDVNLWLSGKCNRREDRDGALAFICKTFEQDASVRNAMNLNKARNDHLLMRRHLFIGRFGFRN